MCYATKAKSPWSDARIAARYRQMGLLGAMYTDRRNATQDQLNERVPLSVARWHRHVNLCFPPKGTDPKSVDWTQFGFNGSIATKTACDSAGGRFYPQVFGWMVHVYPWESDPKLVWAH